MTGWDVLIFLATVTGCMALLSVGWALVVLGLCILRAPRPRPEDYKPCLVYDKRMKRFRPGKKLSDEFVDRIARGDA